MSRQSATRATVVDLSEYRRRRQAERAAQTGAAQPAAPVMWFWVWVFPVACPAVNARLA
jgi:hypothetical protein